MNLLHPLDPFYQEIFSRQFVALRELVYLLEAFESGVVHEFDLFGGPHDEPVVAHFLDLGCTIVHHLESGRHLL